MKNKKPLSFTLVAILLVHFSLSAQTDYIGSSPIPDHPRLLLTRGEEKSVADKISSDMLLRRVNDAIIAETDKLLYTPPIKMPTNRNSMLYISRKAEGNLLFLSYAYRLTKDMKYFKRAETELLAVCSFTDWNPQEYLDDAEITTGVSVAYDWLYDILSAYDRSLIKMAIINKGLKPSYDSKYNTWLRWTNNWSQVCNTSMTLGALAIYEDDPELAKTTINRAIQTIKPAMIGLYSPAGTFEEGYTYWNYGTTYNVILISELQKLFKTDFGLGDVPGFSKTPVYLENMTGPTNKIFNYSDAFEDDVFPDVSMFWFAENFKDPSLLWVERDYLKRKAPSLFAQNNRFLPLLMVWYNPLVFNKIAPPDTKLYVGAGINPVATMRTSWTDTNAIYVGIKVGSPSAGHGHMDIGSFIMDAEGERWAMDLGGGNYTTLIAKYGNIFDMTQKSARWNILRLNNTSHNTISVNNGLQQALGRADFVNSSSNPSNMNVVSDLTQIYKDVLSKSIRGIAIVNSRYVVIRDEVQAIAPGTTVRWQMLTPANVKIISNTKAELTLNNKKLILIVQQPSDAFLKTWHLNIDETSKPSDATNTVIGFETKLQNQNNTPITVLLIPGFEPKEKIDENIKDLKGWPK